MNVLLPIVVAFLGGVFATIGAFIEEAIHTSPFILVLVAPTIEEVLKPSGVIYLFERRRDLLRSKTQIIGLCLIGALVFATLENLLYIGIFHSEHTKFFVFYRLTVCTALHLVCTFIIGVGLSRQLDRIHNAGYGFELEDIMPYLIGAIALHGAYNLTVSLLEEYKIFVVQ